jgi:hypothetical protein
MDLSKRQKLFLKSATWLDNMEINFNSAGYAPAKRIPSKLNRVAYEID